MTTYRPIPEGELNFYLEVAEARAAEGEVTATVSHHMIISMICEIKHLRALCAAMGESGGSDDEVEHLSLMVEVHSAMADELQRMSVKARQQAAHFGYRKTQAKRGPS